MNTSTFHQKNNRRGHILLLAFLLFCSLSGVSQEYTPFARVMFYNVENLFDTQDDPATSDNEFLPNGKKHWTNTRYYQKQNRIAQVIIAAREDDYPDVIGLCEIENQEVLESLLFFTPLNKLDYKIIHKESHDPRGIDVAFLYRNGKFRPLFYEAIPLINSKGHALRTRDILYVKGILGSDTLHFFVNHWPSKYGGISATKLSRATAASTLRAKADSILKLNNQSRIIIMGDFNDTPLDASVKEVLGAKSPETNQVMPGSLYNLALPLAQKGKGSNKFQGKWSLIDQIIVSGSLLDKTNGKTIAGSFQLFSPDFLLENDETNLGKKPNRTYAGYKYHGGFSDHLPVTIELLHKK